MTEPSAEGSGWPPVGPSWPAGDGPAGDWSVAGGDGVPAEAAGPDGAVGATGPVGGAGEGSAAEVLGLLVAAGATVAVAESLTGGLLTAALTDPAGASAAVRGGVVVYATDLKELLAGVPGPLLAAEGAVSPDVAAALAGGVRTRLGATYGLSTTGVAGPDPQGGVPVGTVHVGLAGPSGGRVLSLDLPGDRAAVRAATVRAALGLLAAELRPRGQELPS